MLHLTVDEIIEFVSVENLSEEAMDKIAKVNMHISKCVECREKVRAFQFVYDEFVSLLGCEKTNEMLYDLSESDIASYDIEKVNKYLESNI